MTIGTRLIRIFLGFVGLSAIALALSPAFGWARNYSKRASCSSNLKQLGLALMQYRRDYDGKLPTVKANLGWANAISSYTKSPQLFQCPSDPSPAQIVVSPQYTGFSDYYYNSQIGKRETATLGEASQLVLLAEGNDGTESTSASYSKPGMPPLWRTNPDSPAFRHLKTANYLFLDGNVRSIKVAEISNDWSATKYYFQPPKPQK